MSDDTMYNQLEADLGPSKLTTELAQAKLAEEIAFGEALRSADINRKLARRVKLEMSTTCTADELDATPMGPVSPLPTNSAERKAFPMWTGALAYAPAALALMARTSERGNAKHNPGEPLHHARGKSVDHQDCIVRHMTDYDAMLMYRQRYGEDSVPLDALLEELGNLAWRANLFVQEQCELLGVAPRAPRAVLPTEVAATVLGQQGGGK
jgi:hypothetical protein